VEQLLKDTMEHIVDLSVPLVVDIHSGTNWEEAK
jgi:DNA polymerase-1